MSKLRNDVNGGTAYSLLCSPFGRP